MTFKTIINFYIKTDKNYTISEDIKKQLKDQNSEKYAKNSQATMSTRSD